MSKSSSSTTALDSCPLYLLGRLEEQLDQLEMVARATGNDGLQVLALRIQATRRKVEAALKTYEPALLAHDMERSLVEVDSL